MASSLVAQIAEAEHAIGVLRGEYRRRVARREMRESEADLRLSRMDDVLASLRRLQDAAAGKASRP